MTTLEQEGHLNSAMNTNADSFGKPAGLVSDLEAGCKSVNPLSLKVEVRSLVGEILLGPEDMEASTPLEDIKRRIKTAQEESTKKTLSVKLFLQNNDEVQESALLSELAADDLQDASTLRLTALFCESAWQPPDTLGDVPVIDSGHSRASMPSCPSILSASLFACPLCLTIAAMLVADKRCDLHAWSIIATVLAGLQILTLVCGLWSGISQTSLQCIIFTASTGVCLQCLAVSVAIWGFILQARQRDTCNSHALNLVVASSCFQVVLVSVWCCAGAFGCFFLSALSAIHADG